MKQAKELTPEEQEQYVKSIEPMLQMMMPQVLITFVNRAGGKVQLPAAEIDKSGDYVLDMELVETPKGAYVFEFRTRKKQ